MNRKIISKLLATMLVITLTFANVLLLGNYANKTFATENNLENQPVATNNPNVEFDAYYVDKSNKMSHTIKQDINSVDLQLYLYAKVSKGYLKDIKVNMFGEDETKDTNFFIKSDTKDLATVESIEANSLKLKQLDKDTQVVIKIPVYANKDNVYDIANFNKQNNIKITAKYVDNSGKEINIVKTVKTSIEWNAQVKAVVEQEVVKNINVQEKGIMLQTVVRSGIENNNLPIQKTDINIKVPTIEGIKPEKVLVMANQTKATNKKEGIAFNKDNWNYDETTGELSINTKNDVIENKVSWEKDVKDEYVITYIFPETVAEKITPELEVKQLATTKISVYGATIQEVTATQEIKIDMVTLKGEIVSSSISNSMEKLSKGYFYSKLNKNIEYTQKNVVQIPAIELVDKIVISNSVDTFLAGDKVTYLTDYSVYSKTLISKEIFNTLLGEEGYIKIYNTNKELITTINKDTKVENENYVYNYETPISAVIIETSKPIAEGNLIVENRKAINCNVNYSTEQISSFNILKTTSHVKAINNDKEISNVPLETVVELTQPQTKIEAEINKDNLSTVVKNEGVQIKTILKTNDESCMLYENPVIEIELPSYVENIEINNINIGYTNALRYDESKLEITTNNSGNKVIRLPLIGKDEDYNFDNISKGANIIIDANITIAKLTPTTSSQINVNVYNNNGKSQTANAKIGITAVAPIGMVATTQVSKYSARNVKAMALNGQEQTLKLDVNAEQRNVAVQMDIINNYNNICRNILILGKIPYQVSSLKTPITLNGVDTNNVTVYYSSNENASTDLNVEANAWTTNTQNLSQAKSYLIVINNFEMQTGKNIQANFELLIPENLKYNLESKLTYTVYYDNVTEEQTIKDSTVAANTTLTTGQGPELEVVIRADIENGVEVQEGTDIKYSLTVKNTGKTVVENVTLKGVVPENSTYFYYKGDAATEEGLSKEYDSNKKEHSIKIETIQPNETKLLEYEVTVKDIKLADKEKKLELNAYAEAIVDGYDTAFKSNNITNEIIEGYVKVKLQRASQANEYTRKELEADSYIVEIENVNSIVKNNVEVSVKLPEEFMFEGTVNKSTFNQTNNTITWEIGNLNGYAKKILPFNVTIAPLEEGVYEKTATMQALLSSEENEIVSNELPIVIKKEELTIKQSSTTPNEVVEGDKIGYDIVVENKGKGNADGVKVIAELTDGVKLKEVEYVYGGKTYKATVGTKKSMRINFPVMEAESKLEIHMEAVAERLADNETRKEVKNVVKVSSQLTEEITANEITHVVVKNGSGEVKDPTTGDEIEEGTYTISGLAWLDANKDGKREAEEKPFENIQVMLINADNGEIVKDIKTNQDKIQTTNSQGQYVFANIKEGKYIVVYLYDTDNYDLTAYKKEGVLDTNNSDAMPMKVKYEGKEIQAAATDTIEITNSNVSNMDIGLITKDKFNLSLDKAISKIIVKNSKGTKTYEYNNSKLAKLDIDSKTLNGTSIIIEYKITVSNIGAVPGYVKKIVDYIPKDMKFSSELNSDWYVSDSGDAYNSSLATTVINPGEIKEVKLLLTKNLTEQNLGTINNRAEIYEAYNDFGIQDEDSTPGNKVENENDMSYADAVIGIKTGEAVVYIGITLVCIVSLGVGTYFIKKKILRKI